MEGRIKFVDPKTRKWGFIVPADKSRDVHFDIGEFVGPTPSVADADAPVTFELVEQGTSREAKRIQLVNPPAPVAIEPATDSADLNPAELLKVYVLQAQARAQDRDVRERRLGCVQHRARRQVVRPDPRAVRA